MSNLKIGFELERIPLSLENILPVRQLKDPRNTTRRYLAIRASLKEVGLIEPLMVYPHKGKKGTYLLLDGHLRFYAMRELGIREAECIVSSDDESFTYNARVSRINPIQEHKMIMKAIQNGVGPDRIAAALAKNERDIVSSMNLLDGLHPDAVDALKDKDICIGAIRLFKRVKPLRQIEMAELMVSANTYSKGYVEALLVGTPKEQLTHPEVAKVPKGLTVTEIARMEQEMESLQRDFKTFEDGYGENVLNLTLSCRYIGKLLQNPKVTRYLATRYEEMHGEFQAVAAMESL